ncbi:hypothetical protein KSP40_PGU002928 [Platanthera guangdongensis]|uniref:Uncharacterized protein n=1 Tax=Platanthera guangdongensis TaxID=2320717 RepID=A0ABR2M4V7_9ASPA
MQCLDEQACTFASLEYVIAEVPLGYSLASFWATEVFRRSISPRVDNLSMFFSSRNGLTNVEYLETLSAAGICLYVDSLLRSSGDEITTLQKYMYQYKRRSYRFRIWVVAGDFLNSVGNKRDFLDTNLIRWWSISTNTLCVDLLHTTSKFQSRLVSSKSILCVGEGRCSTLMLEVDTLIRRRGTFVRPYREFGKLIIDEGSRGHPSSLILDFYTRILR